MLGCPPWAWKSDPKLGVTVVFQAPEVTPEVTKLIRLLNGEMLRRDLQAAMDLKDDEHFRKTDCSDDTVLNRSIRAKTIETIVRHWFRNKA
jgi:hypothetical protein